MADREEEGRGVLPPARVRRPDAPIEEVRPEGELDLDPQRRAVLDSLTPDEWRYVFSKIRSAARKVAKGSKVSSGRVVGSALGGLDRWGRYWDLIEKYVTVDYEVPHPDEIRAPVRHSEGEAGQRVPTLGAYIAKRLMDILDNALGSEHVQRGIGDFLTAIAKKIEEGE